MSSYQLYQQISRDKTHTYKLLQLPPELLNQLDRAADNQDDDELLIKSDINSLVLCTKNQTWKLRQMNHSNTVLLLSNLNMVKNKTSLIQSDDSLIGFQDCNYEYELTKTQGIVDFTTIPKYDGTYNNITDSTNNKSIRQLLDDSLCSEIEFWKLWYEQSGCEIDDIAYIMSKPFITEILYDLITYLISKEINYNQSIELQQLDSLLSPKINPSMIISILHRFATIEDGDIEHAYKLNHIKISQWFGMIELSKRASHQLLTIPEFLIGWKGSLPPFYNISLDIEYLKGWYAMPQDGHILFVDRDELSQNIGIRFKQLFEVDSNWDYDLFMAFIKDIVPKDKKLDAIIIKFGKKKKIGKDKFIVCPR